MGVRGGVALAALLGAIGFSFPTCLDAQDAVLPDRERVDVSGLVPHRLRLDPGDYMSDVFDTPQVYISLERTTHYVDSLPRGALRVRWVANTHAHEDEVLLDEATFTVVQVETLARNIRSPGRVMAFLRGDSVTSVTLDATGETSSVTVPWAEPAYHLMMLPYWLAALDADSGERFVLPQFSARSGTRSTIHVEVLGRDGEGSGEEGGDLWHYRSDHGWVEVDWYIDKRSPPYLRRMVWHYKGGPRDGVSVDQSVAEWHVFHGDVYRNVVR